MDIGHTVPVLHRMEPDLVGRPVQLSTLHLSNSFAAPARSPGGSIFARMPPHSWSHTI